MRYQVPFLKSSVWRYLVLNAGPLVNTLTHETNELTFLFILGNTDFISAEEKDPTNNSDIKQYDGETAVILKLCGMQSNPSLPSFLWRVVVAPDRALSMGQIELNWVLMLNWIVWNRTVWILKLRTNSKLNCLKWNCLFV